MDLKTRKQLRLRSFDYNSNAYYFITICTHNRYPYFGKIIDSKLSSYSPFIENLIENSLKDLEDNFPSVEVIQHTLMPNHIHFILANGSDGKYNLGQIIRRFKSKTTIAYKKEAEKHSLKPLDESLWQRSYHEIIIRNQKQFEALWTYSVENPIKWEMDKYYE